eukprot:g4166.t1
MERGDWATAKGMLDFGSTSLVSITHGKPRKRLAGATKGLAKWLDEEGLRKQKGSNESKSAGPLADDAGQRMRGKDAATAIEQEQGRLVLDFVGLLDQPNGQQAAAGQRPRDCKNKKTTHRTSAKPEASGKHYDAALMHLAMLLNISETGKLFNIKFTPKADQPHLGWPEAVRMFGVTLFALAYPSHVFNSRLLRKPIPVASGLPINPNEDYTQYVLCCFRDQSFQHVDGNRNQGKNADGNENAAAVDRAFAALMDPYSLQDLRVVSLNNCNVQKRPVSTPTSGQSERVFWLSMHDQNSWDVEVNREAFLHYEVECDNQDLIAALLQRFGGNTSMALPFLPAAPQSATDYALENFFWERYEALADGDDADAEDGDLPGVATAVLTMCTEEGLDVDTVIAEKIRDALQDIGKKVTKSRKTVKHLRTLTRLGLLNLESELVRRNVRGSHITYHGPGGATTLVRNHRATAPLTSKQFVEKAQQLGGAEEYATPQKYLDGAEIPTFFQFQSNMVTDEDLKPGMLRNLDVDKRLTLPTRTHIRCLITSHDVLHAWAVPALDVKIDCAPGRINRIFMFIQREGVYYGQCSELCGSLHAFMPVVIEAVAPERYAKHAKKWDTSSSSTPGPRAVTYTPSPGCVGGLRCVRKAQDPNCVRLLYAMCLLAQHRENEAHNIVTLLDCATGAGEDVEDKLRRAEELALVPGDIFTAVLARPKPPRAGPRGENFFEKSIEEMGDLLMGSASSGSDLSDGEEESINMGKGTGCATKNAANANYVAVRKRPAWRDAADYVHALIHRHEGPAISEHNMTGFQNSNALLKNLPTDHAKQKWRIVDPIRRVTVVVETFAPKPKTVRNKKEQKAKTLVGKEAETLG